LEEKKEICSSRQEVYDTASEMVKNEQEIVKIKLNQLSDFKNHPFKVEYNTELFELMQSIEADGILVPLLVRPKPKGQGYEIIAGHRRKAACEWAGIGEVPAIVRNLNDRQAVIAMVNSNLQRENTKPSEKAFAYRMRLEAMKQQGKRTDLTSCQVGKRLDREELEKQDLQSESNPTLELWEVTSGINSDGIWEIKNEEQQETAKINSNRELSAQYGESQRQINRYIRLTYLIPKLLDMVDAEKIAFTVAVELSYLKEEEQYELHAVMDLEQCTPSLSQANRLKRLSQGGKLDMDEIYQVMEEEKPNQKPQLKIKVERLEKYFPQDFTERQKVELIEKLVKEWYQNQPQVNKGKKR
jgi:ParB family chromosome partitioning protein